MLTVESLNFKSFLAHPLPLGGASRSDGDWGHCAWHDIGDRGRDTAHR
jgi:hypothetical protein